MKSKFFTNYKRVLIALICCFCAFALCGCGSAHYSVTVSSNGVITLQLDLKFDANELTQSLNSAGRNLTDFMSGVKVYANAVYNNSYAQFQSDLNEVAVDGVVETYSGEASTLAVKKYVNENTEFLNGYIDDKSSGWFRKDNTYYYTIILRFKTYNAYRYFNGIYPATENQANEDVEEFRNDYFFFAEDYTVSKSVFNDIQNKTYAKDFIQYFNNVVSVDDMTYSYSYSTPSTKIYSNADEIYVDSNTGNTVHTWKFTNDELKSGNSTITTYQVKIRAWVWYVMAVVVTIIVGAVLYIIVKIKDNKRKKIFETNAQNYEQKQQENEKAENTVLEEKF